MTLEDLINELKNLPPDARVRHGFGDGSSYRGNYADVAFAPVEDAQIGDMLMSAREVLNQKFPGYKGGEYRMHPWVDCYIAEWGQASGDRIGWTLFRYWQDEVLG